MNRTISTTTEKASLVKPSEKLHMDISLAIFKCDDSTNINNIKAEIKVLKLKGFTVDYE